MLMRRICKLILAVAIPALTVCSAQDDEPEYKPRPTADVNFKITPQGDVDISIWAQDLQPVSLSQLRSAALPCDWKLQTDMEDYLSGTCRKLLTSDGTSTEGGVPVGGLVVALRALGAYRVRLSVNGFAPFQSSPGKGWYLRNYNLRGNRRSSERMYFLDSYSMADTPMVAVMRVGKPWSAGHFATPFAVTLFAPAILAFWLRRRSLRRGSRPSVVVWLNWMLNGMFLYWISALSPTDVAGFNHLLHLESAVALVAMSALVFSIPPLLAVAMCTILMHPAEERGQAVAAARNAAMQTAVFLVPLGIFISGSQSLNVDGRVGVASILAAYAVFKILSLTVARAAHGNIQLLAQGALPQRAQEIAQRAGVKLQGLYLTDNRVRRQANAFASGTGVVMVSRGLAENLTRREVDSVLAHEIGHLRGKHTISSIVGFWVYILVLQPIAVTLVATSRLPAWVITLPFLPVLYIMGTAWLSRGREFNADKRAVELTGDPEGMIAGLARLRLLTDSPVAWGGMQGSILSHPSMQARVLAIARQFHVDENRALALLENPDLIEAHSPYEPVAAESQLPAHYELPQRSILFSTFAKEARGFWARWAMNAVLVSELFCIAVLVDRIDSGSIWWNILAFLAGIALVVRTFLGVDNFLVCRFMKRIRRVLEIQRNLPRGSAIFAGVLPGERVSLPEGYPMWDVGFLFLSPDYLTYEGEQTTFSVPRTEVTGVTVQKGPLSWTPNYVVTVTWLGGAFSLTRPDLGTVYRRRARRLAAQLQGWWRGEPLPQTVTGVVSPTRFPQPALPQLSVSFFRGWKAVRVLGWRACMLFIGAIMVSQALAVKNDNMLMSLMPLMVPVCYILAVCPLFFRRTPVA